MRLEHPIFQGPLAVKIDLKDIETPKNYRSYPEGKDLPDTIKVWQVHTGEFGTDGKGVDVGLVSQADVEDTPDGEWISGGVNSKGPRSLALGRQGNLFFWGFYGDPDRLTESGKRVFLNALCYIRKFDGQTPLVARKSHARTRLTFWISYVRNQNALDSAPLIEHLKSELPAAAFVKDKLDADALEAWCNENLEYVHDVKGKLVVDEELKRFGASNRKPELFEKLGARLRENASDPLARTLLERYAPGAPLTAEGLDAWVETRRATLKFSDAGGFRWYWLTPQNVK